MLYTCFSFLLTFSVIVKNWIQTLGTIFKSPIWINGQFHGFFNSKRHNIDFNSQDILADSIFVQVEKQFLNVLWDREISFQCWKVTKMCCSCPGQCQRREETDGGERQIEEWHWGTKKTAAGKREEERRYVELVPS